jgi:hypothetical protein
MTTTPEVTQTPEPVETPESALAQETVTPEDTPTTAQPSANAQPSASWTVSDWLGKVIIDQDGDKIGKLHDVYVDVETDEPMFGTIKEGFVDRHLTFVPLVGVQVGPDGLRAAVRKAKVKSAPDLDLHGQEMSQADESALYHHFEMNYTPIVNDSGRRLARR